MSSPLIYQMIIKDALSFLGQPIYLRQWYGRSVPWRFRLASQGTESWSLPRNFFEGLKEGKEKDVMI